MAILLKTTSVRVSAIQIMQVRDQNKGKSVWKSTYDGDVSIYRPPPWLLEFIACAIYFHWFEMISIHCLCYVRSCGLKCWLTSISSNLWHLICIFLALILPFFIFYFFSTHDRCDLHFVEIRWWDIHGLGVRLWPPNRMNQIGHAMITPLILIVPMICTRRPTVLQMEARWGRRFKWC